MLFNRKNQSYCPINQRLCKYSDFFANHPTPASTNYAPQD